MTLIQTRFQPIVTGAPGDWRLMAFECLSRGVPGSSLGTADALFGRMRSLGLEVGIDRACVTRALETAREHDIDDPLFINVHATTLCSDHDFVPYLATTALELGIHPTRLVVEVIEHSREHCSGGTARVLRALEHVGIAVALDDFGANSEDPELLRHWTPRFVKLDGNLLRWARRSSAARQVIENTVADVVRRGGEVIAEGLEHEGDVALADGLGIRHLQGYAISRPLMPAAAAMFGMELDGVGFGTPATRNDATERVAV